MKKTSATDLKEIITKMVGKKIEVDCFVVEIYEYFYVLVCILWWAYIIQKFECHLPLYILF